jgi:lysophospholipase L1-like esterase
MIFEGVNDIGNSGGDVSDQLIKAFTQIVNDAKKLNLKTIGATITPFGGSSYAGGSRESARKKVNNWILTSKTFDYTVDFSAAITSKSSADQIDSALHGGDHLHPNGAGYQAMANAFPLDIFKS